MTTLRDIADNFKKKMMTNPLVLNQMVKSSEKVIENKLPLPLTLLKENKKIEKCQYNYYILLIEQMVLSEILDKYITTYLFAYDMPDFDIKYALVKLKEKIEKEEIICDEFIVNEIFPKIDSYK